MLLLRLWYLASAERLAGRAALAHCNSTAGGCRCTTWRVACCLFKADPSDAQASSSAYLITQDNDGKWSALMVSACIRCAQCHMERLLSAPVETVGSDISWQSSVDDVSAQPLLSPSQHTANEQCHVAGVHVTMSLHVRHPSLAPSISRLDELHVYLLAKAATNRAGCLGDHRLSCISQYPRCTDIQGAWLQEHAAC
jgi:hypothetical protein